MNYEHLTESLKSLISKQELTNKTQISKQKEYLKTEETKRSKGIIKFSDLRELSWKLFNNGKLDFTLHVFIFTLRKFLLEDILCVRQLCDKFY